MIVYTHVYILLVNRNYTILDMYIMDVKTKTTAAAGSPEIVKETIATALVEGNNILG